MGGNADARRHAGESETMILTEKSKYPVRVARLMARLSKKELAKRLNLSKSKYERLEKRTQKIRLRTFFKVLIACNLQIELLWPDNSPIDGVAPSK